MSKNTPKADAPTKTATPKADAPEGQVWMERDGERTLVSDDASVEIMAELGWAKV